MELQNINKILDKKLSNEDYKQLDFKCGIEIHKQLNCGKLFSHSPCSIVENNLLDKQIIRKLRFTLGENGKVDKAALNEFKLGKYNIYKYNDEVANLVELDELPPRQVNPSAYLCCLKICKYMNLNFFDKVEFMRKIIVDGSCVSGFQRTAMLGLNGHIFVGDMKVGINGINLEEDSSRIIEKNEKYNIYSLDRLGIPLVEITTAPDMKTPKQVYDTAKYIGDILKSFKESRRGIGTIRQDLNVSISGSKRIEIKGAQSLENIEDIVEIEVKRQKILLNLNEYLVDKKITKLNYCDKKIIEINSVFKNTTSKIILDNIKNKNSIFAVKLNGLKNILGLEIQKNYRVATEISNRNKRKYKSIKGLFHYDELPNYGIVESEIEDIKKELNILENDNFIILAIPKKIKDEVFENIFNIIEEIFFSISEQVRQVNSKTNETIFLRDMPTSSRMYPETDLKKIDINRGEIEKLELPELYPKKIERLEKEFKVDKNVLLEFLNKYDEVQIKELIKVSQKSANDLYKIIFELTKDIKKREKIENVNFSYELLKNILKISQKNDLSNQILRDIFVSILKENFKEVDKLEKFIEDKKLLVSISDEEIEKVVKSVVEENKGAPFGALIGKIMQKFNGKVDGKKVSMILNKLN